MAKNNNKKTYFGELKKELSTSMTIPMYVALFALLGGGLGATQGTFISGAILGGFVGLSWGAAFYLKKKKKEQQKRDSK